METTYFMRSAGTIQSISDGHYSDCGPVPVEHPQLLKA